MTRTASARPGPPSAGAVREDTLARETEGVDIGQLLVLSLWRWARSSPSRAAWVGRRVLRIRLAERRRIRRQQQIGGVIPLVVAISPTMRCNYDCVDCYSRGRPTDGELTINELDTLLREAEDLGVLVVAVTGGEPLLREGLLEILASHQRLLVVLFTNGSLMTAEIARSIAGSGNVLPLVSIEGRSCDTDERRQEGAHAAALGALASLRKAGACYGFAAMSTALNSYYLTSDGFVDQMASLGCVFGLLTEYVPCEASTKREWFPTEAVRGEMRRRVLSLRRRKRVALIQLPYDEYGTANRCSAAGRALLHITSQGDVEPCPFVPIACGNTRRGGLTGACRSPFPDALSETPELLHQDRPVCRVFADHVERAAALRRSGARPRPHSLEGQGLV